MKTISALNCYLEPHNIVNIKAHLICSFIWFNLTKKSKNWFSSLKHSAEACWGPIHYHGQWEPIRSEAPGRQVCRLLSEDDTCLSWQHRAGHAQGRHWFSAFTLCPQAHLPCRASPSSPFPDFGQKMCNSQSLLLMSPLSYLTALENSWQTRPRAHTGLYFSFSCSFAPFLWRRNLPPLVRQGWVSELCLFVGALVWKSSPSTAY